MKSITLLHYSAPPVVGGVEAVLGHHARLMADAGHQVQVVAGRGQPSDSRVRLLVFPLLDSVHPEILAAKGALDAGRLPPGFDSLVSTIAAFLTDTLRSTDILIAHNVCSLHKNLALTSAVQEVASAHRDMRLILWHHDLAWAAPRYRADLHEGYPWQLLKTPWPGAIHVAISEQRRRELADLLRVEPSSISVVPNGIDHARFLKLDDQTVRIARQLDLQSASPLLLLPVRITPRKNIEMALRVLAHLREEFPSAQLLVTGPPGSHNRANASYLHRLLALRAELGVEWAVHFMAELSDEPLSDRVVSDLYTLADALFLPSQEEGFGLPILEAALSRLPVICADIPSLRSLGGPDVTYFSLSTTPQHVARLIATSLRASPVFGLQTRVKDRYTWARVYSESIAPLLG